MQTCKVCGNAFYVRPCRVKSGEGIFCSSKCFGVFNRKRQKGDNNPNWKGGKIKLCCKVCKKLYFVYLSEIKKIQTCSKKCHSKLMVKIQQGKNNSCWRGNNAKYHALHYRVRVKKGNPSFCEVCKTDDKEKIYHWANLTGSFLEIKDYKRMCMSCHKKYDVKRKTTITNGG